MLRVRLQSAVVATSAGRTKALVYRALTTGYSTLELPFDIHTSTAGRNIDKRPQIGGENSDPTSLSACAALGGIVASGSLDQSAIRSKLLGTKSGH